MKKVIKWSFGFDIHNRGRIRHIENNDITDATYLRLERYANRCKRERADAAIDRILAEFGRRLEVL